MKRMRGVELMAFAAVLAVAVAIAFNGSGYAVQVLTSTAIFIVLACGWNIISGLTGYVSFGQVAFFGLGAYLAAGLIVNLHVPWYAAAALAGLGAAVVAAPLGAIMLRLQGIFFALGMFGLARIGQIAATSMGATGGAMGESVPTTGNALETTLTILGLACGAVLLTHLLMGSRLGLQLMAVRDDEAAAKGAGVHADAVKVAAFCISGCLAGLAGALYVWNIAYVDPTSAFNGTIELQTILMVLVGGIGSTWGPVIGAILISLLGQVLWARFPMQEQIILGAITILVVIVAPGGLVSIVNRFGWLQRRPVWSPPPAPGVPPGTRPPLGAAFGKGRNARLRGEHLRKQFGGVVAVGDVNLTTEEGSILAIIGPNGAGKSTLFDLLSGFARPTEGKVYFGDRELTGIKPHIVARSGIARTFQTSRVFPSLTVWETVLLASSSLNRSRRVAAAETARILSQVGLLDQWASLPERLSPGQQRLLEIARALALHPRVLLLDEAMAGMTPQEIGRVHAVLAEVVRQGCSIVAIEHVLPAIAPLASRVQVLDFGKTIAEGPPALVFRDPDVVEAYLGVGEQAAVDAGI
ncbi:branched-chain amino acid ABC transporter ATP-binding protein/permease [bacterium]|nr:MAG: branched-chain amino acid ABC transporter ATP-binding protein/permease [bacterium]